MEIKCTGNNNNGCFMDSPAIDCGCEGLKEFGKKLKNSMDKNVIKKELYKQKPTADLNREYDDCKEYTCQILIDGQMRVVFFNVPIKECEFSETVPAQLLIRWMV